jgi:murein DD-endopeptidase MepM/ murein hydrolase activator NlpD
LRRAPVVQLGEEPPLDASGMNSPAIDRRAVSLRWLAASVLTGLSGAALIGGAIHLSLEGQGSGIERAERVFVAARPGESQQVATRKGDKLVRNELVVGARRTFRSPMTIRAGDREVIKVRAFTRVATELLATTGTYATNIPPFNPLRMFAEGSDLPERYADAPPEVSDADVSVVKRELVATPIPPGAGSLVDEDVIAQVEEERRLQAEQGRRNPIPIAPQLLLSRTLRQPVQDLPALAFGGPIEAPFSAIEVSVLPENVSELRKADAVTREPGNEERLVQVRKGENLDQALKTLGASPDQIRGIVAALGGRARINALPEGQNLRVLLSSPLTGGARQVVRVMLVNESGAQAIAAQNDLGAYVAVAIAGDDRPARSETASRRTDEEEDDDEGTGARLYDSFYETAMKYELPRPAIDELVRVFSYDVDFQRRVGSGDSMELFFVEDEEGSDRIEMLSAALTIGGETRRVYRFVTPEDGIIDYFDEEGRSLKKFLLRKPIAEGEMRSGFGFRRHPILGYSKMHTGVDWSNRIGTPILASGNGTVIKAEWDSGYGRRVEIQHANGYVTTYSHMSGFARNIRPGTRVQQGQVIGYLGNTGLSTGPHLHYEVMVNGHFVNPLKIKVPRGRELEGRVLAEFKRQRDQIEALASRSLTAERVSQN